MKEEYKTAMEEISLSDDDRVRILANVLKTCEDAVGQPMEENINDNVFAHTGRLGWSLKFSPRRIGAVAAAFIVLCVSVVLIRNQYITVEDSPSHQDTPGSAATMGASMEVVWEEFDSVEEIAEKTDCKTYTLANLSRKYKVKKVEVANAQKHVKITYQRKKKKDDRIFFEYKEESDSDEIKRQFSEETELVTEKVAGADVKMYGQKKCSGMTWEDSDCTFAVKMSKACSTDNARRIVSGAQEEKKHDKTDKDPEEVKYIQRLVNSNIIGWDGSEKESSEKEKKKILKKVYDNLGFRILLNAPAVEVTYKYVSEYESFAFYYEGDEALKDKWIIGYAGGGSPEGTLEDYDKASDITAGNATVEVYLRDNDEKLLIFTKEDICFTVFLDEYDEDVTAEFLGSLLSVFKISFDEESGESDETEEPDPSPTPDDGDLDPDSEEDPASGSGVDCYAAAQELQEIVAGKSLKKLSAYISYPMEIRSLGITVNSRADFQHLDAGQIFTSEWVDAILFCDVEKIKPKAKSFTLGDSENSLVCKVKDGAVVITELHVVADDTAMEDGSNMEEPGEETSDDESEFY